MTAPDTTPPTSATPAPAPSWREAWAVYLQPRVLIVLMLGFSSGLPLALSGRCYHARLHGLHKDSCQFTCEKDADGLAVDTLDDQPFLAINGIQTLSYGYLNLAAEIEDMLALGIGHFRLSPHRTDMIAVATIFADRLAGRSDGPTAMKALGALGIGPFVNGFWHGLAGHLYRDQRVGTGLA